MRPEPTLTFGTAAKALTLGALTGAVLTGLPFSFWFGPAAVAVTLVAFPVWAWGLLCVGVPAWTVLHAGGVRDGRVAVVLGAALSFLTAVLLGRDLGGGETGFLAEPPVVQGLIAAIGAVVGRVVWSVAYDAGAA